MVDRGALRIQSVERTSNVTKTMYLYMFIANVYRYVMYNFQHDCKELFVFHLSSTIKENKTKNAIWIERKKA